MREGARDPRARGGSPPAAAPAAGPASVPAPAAAPVSAPVLAPALPAPTAATSVDDVPGAVRANAAAIQEAAALVRAADPTRAWAYRLQRWASWVLVETTPPVENGRTRLPAPPKDLRRRLDSLREGEKWPTQSRGRRAPRRGSTSSGSTSTGRWPSRSIAWGRRTRPPARSSAARRSPSWPASPAWPTSPSSTGPPSPTRAPARGSTRRSSAGAGEGGPSAAATSGERGDERGRPASPGGGSSRGKVAEGARPGALALSQRGADGRARFGPACGGRPDGHRGLEARAGPPRPRGAPRPGDRPGPRNLGAQRLCATVYAALLVAIRSEARASKSPPAELAGRGQFVFERLCRLDPAAALRLSGT